MDTTSPPSSTPLLRRRSVRWALVGVGVLLLAIGGFVFWFFGDDAPDEVDLATAVETVTEGTEPAAAPVPTEEGVDGTWTVDTTLGTFDFESATGSFVGFRIDEELGRGIGQTEAVGRTGTVSGTLEISGTTLEAAEITATLADLTTDRSGRDGAARRALDTGSFPDATFVLDAPVDLGAAALEGEPVAVSAPGQLTVKDVTNPVVFDLEAQLVDGVIVVVGSTEVTFADYGVSVPSAGIVVSVEDFGTVELQLLFTR